MSSSSLEKYEIAKSLIDQILSGQKPQLDPSQPDHAWLINMLQRMYDGGFLEENPEQYYQDSKQIRLKPSDMGVTYVHPLDLAEIKRAQEIKDILGNRGVFNFQMLSGDFSLRETADQQAIRAQSPHQVLPAADLYGLRNFLAQAILNITERNDNKPTIYIDNQLGFYDPLIAFLGEESMTRAQVKCVHGATDLMSMMQLSGHDLSSKPEPLTPPVSLKPGAIIAYHTSDTKKFDYVKRTIEASNADATVIPADQVLGWVLSADETSLTYGGNSQEKIEHIIERIYEDLGVEEVKRRLKKAGIDPDNFVFMTNDTGITIDLEGLEEEPEMQLARHKATLGKPFPGVELGPIISAFNGMLNFMKAVQAVVDRRRSLGKITGPVTVTDHNIYTFFKLADTKEQVQPWSVHSTAKGVLRFTPSDASNGLDASNFVIPMEEYKEHGNQGRTRAELGEEYIAHSSSVSRCMDVMLGQTGLRNTKKARAKADHKKAAQQETIKVAGFEDFLASYKDQDLEEGDLSQADSFFKQTDAIKLGALSEEVLEDPDETFWERMSFFYSRIVAGQIKDTSVTDKPFVVGTGEEGDELRSFFENLQDKWDEPGFLEQQSRKLADIDLSTNPWSREAFLYSYLHHLSFIKDRPAMLFQHCFLSRLNDAVESIVSIFQLKKASQTSIELNFEEPNREVLNGSDEAMVAHRDRFSVSVLGSAGTFHKPTLDGALKIGYAVGEMGGHLRTGGGREGVMGAAAKGMQHFRRDNPDKKHNTFLSGIQMPHTIKTEGLNKENDFLVVEPNMPAREKALFESDIMVAMPGGAGTIQEIADFMRLVRRGDPMVQGKKMIIVNAETAPGQIRFFDPLKAMIPKKDLESGHLIFCNSENEAIQLMHQIRTDTPQQRLDRRSPWTAPQYAM